MMKIDPYNVRYNPFDRERITLSHIDDATCIPQIEHLLCSKAAYGSGAVLCEKCTDRACRVGKKVRELKAKDAREEQLSMLKGSDDPNWDVYNRAIESGKPVLWLVTSGRDLLTVKYPRFTRRQALQFLKDFQSRYAKDAPEKALVEALDVEDRANYDMVARRQAEGMRDAFIAEALATKYRIRPQEAMAYIDDLRERYGSKAPITPSATVSKKTGMERAFNERYEELNDRLQVIQEEYDLRKTEIEEELDLIDRMIEMYEGFLEKMIEEETKLARYPEASKDTDLIDISDLDEEEEP